LGAYSYRIAGLSVSSVVVLPGIANFADDNRPVDVTIRQGAVEGTLSATDVSSPFWQIDREQILFRIPNIARFQLRAGNEITFEAENGTPIEDVAPFLAGSAFGALLHQRGLVVLHASAVRVADKAVLFCGPSGAGKSTIAAVLAKRSYPLVADDFCAIDLGAVPMVQPDARQLKLWSVAIERLGLGANCGAPVYRRADKYFVEPNEASDEPLPIGAVYVLWETHPPPTSCVEPLKPVDAVARLIQNAYRPQMTSGMDQRAQYFKAAAAIANAAQIFRLTRPQNLADLPDIVSRLECHWAAIGLTARVA
jgi:hypothetical protein